MNNGETIYVVDDDECIRNIITETLKDQYNVRKFHDGSELVRYLNDNKETPGAIILDINMPILGGWETAEHILNKRENVPIIMLSGEYGNESKEKLQKLRIAKTLHKPIKMKNLAETVKYVSTHNLFKDELDIRCGISKPLIDLISKKEGNTYNHQLKVGENSKIIAKALRYSEDDCETIKYCCAMHDIGKYNIDDSLLNKPGIYTESERNIMKNHTLDGGKIIEQRSKYTNNIEFLNRTKIVCEQHHENMDGSGYPRGLKGDQISMDARIGAGADRYCAMVEDRPYKRAKSHEEALDILRKEAKQNKLDSVVVDAIIENEGIIKQIGHMYPINAVE